MLCLAILFFVLLHSSQQPDVRGVEATSAAAESASKVADAARSKRQEHKEASSSPVTTSEANSKEAFKEALAVAKSEILKWELANFTVPKFLNKEVEEDGATRIIIIPPIPSTVIAEAVKVGLHRFEGVDSDKLSESLTKFASPSAGSATLLVVQAASEQLQEDQAYIYPYEPDSPPFFVDPETGRVGLTIKSAVKDEKLTKDSSISLRYGHLFKLE
jgi:hypothetical protein